MYTTAIYKSFDNINNFKIRIKLKEIKSAILEEENVNTSVTELTISWQQKIFSEDEILKYEDDNNCLTELEKKYNAMIKTGEFVTNSRIFTFIDADQFDSDDKHTAKSKKKMVILKRKKNTDEKSEKNKTESDFSKQFQYMYILAKLDDSESLNDKIKSKKQVVLCSLKWNETRKALILFPDFSKEKDEPYQLEVDSDSRNVFHYWIENASKDISDTIRYQQFRIAQDLLKRKQTSKIISSKSTEFGLIPSKDEIYFHIFIEISAARQFEPDDLLVQFYIDLEDNWRVHDDYKTNLYGVTQVVKAHTDSEFNNISMFGYPFNILLVYNLKGINSNLVPFKFPTIYFEIISKDTWSRYRTEGYTYKTIPVNQLGVHKYSLPCLRVKPCNHWEDLHNFFIGGCSMLDDITWLGIPTNHQDSVLNKFGITTEESGVLDIKFQIISQSSTALLSKEIGKVSSNIDFLYSSSLVKSINEVLRAFKKARDTMNNARKKLYT